MAELLLIRHGQASFAAEDYDQLSAIGETQSRRLGSWLAANEKAPSLIASGTLRRHAQTVAACLNAATVDATRLTLSGLDELDHREILQCHRPDLDGHGAIATELRRSDDPHRAFQLLFVAAVARWTSGEHDHDYACPWPVFQREALAALQTLADRAREAAGPVWAITSGGPIAVMVGELLGISMARTFELSWPLVNTSLTRIEAGQRQGRLITYNAWPHLAGHADLITHR